MKKFLQKMSVITIITMSLSTIPIQSFGVTNEVNKSIIESAQVYRQTTLEEFNKIIEQAKKNESTIESTQIFKQMPQITPEQLNKALEKAIEIEVKSHYQDVKNEAEAKNFENQLRSVFADTSASVGVYVVIPPYESDGDILYSSDTWIPNLKIANINVAAAVNVILNTVLIAIGCGSIALALKKYGATQLRLIFTNSLKTKVLGRAAVFLSISLTSIADYLMYILDPAAAVARLIDSKDSLGTTGYFDVIW